MMRKTSSLLALAWLFLAHPAQAESASSVFIPVNRSTLVSLNAPASEVLVANPDIADVHVHNATHVTIVGKSIGSTTVRILGKDRAVLREMDVKIGYDLPAIRKSLKNFLPEETIGVEMVNNGIALTGKVTSASVVDKALKITKEFLNNSSSGAAAAAPASADAKDQPAAAATDASGTINILNFMQVTSGQQVMLRVRVGEINRTALKALGMNLSAGVTDGFQFATGAGLAGLIQPVDATGSEAASYGLGHFLFPSGSNNMPANTQGGLFGHAKAGKITLAGALTALEQDGLFKLLAEPNLVAISGEQAEFLAGGEIPIPVPQGGSGSANTITIEYKPYGVAVHFKPSVLSENLIHMEVQPEVSELDPSNTLKISGFDVPALTTRRAKTTVELAPGEGFMIAGLLKDQTSANISQLPGAKDLPILGALFRSTEFQRNETELVIAVTPYIVDPQKSGDVKLPSDDFRPASQMEMFFYGALGSLSGKPKNNSQPPGLEGPTGFMMD